MSTRTLTLVLGGARSGKSAFAERLAATQGGSVLYVATAEALDTDMATRIRAHRAARPAAWHTLEAPRDLVGPLGHTAGAHDTVLLDCLTLWVSNLLLDGQESSLSAQMNALLDVYRAGTASWVVVSNEVGLGVVPPTPLGARYRDLLGQANQAVAAAADRVFLMIAGLAVDLTALGARSWRGAVP
jgi:adenosylcobinamide kinase/adenosylcobinamide-phosphate guanylyltransferase